MLTYKQLKQNLNEASKVVKTLKVGKKSTAEIQQNGSKFSVVIDGEVLDDKYKSAKDAEAAAKEFADLMGT
jgi:uncharacterized protein YacL (UPF0231 family)